MPHCTGSLLSIVKPAWSITTLHPIKILRGSWCCPIQRRLMPSSVFISQSLQKELGIFLWMPQTRLREPRLDPSADSHWVEGLWVVIYCVLSLITLYYSASTKGEHHVKMKGFPWLGAHLLLILLSIKSSSTLGGGLKGIFLSQSRHEFLLFSWQAHDHYLSFLQLV